MASITRSPTANSTWTASSRPGFSNPTNAYAEDASIATGDATAAPGPYPAQNYHGFDFSDIPVGSTIDGIKVRRKDSMADGPAGFQQLKVSMLRDASDHNAASTGTTNTTNLATYLGNPLTYRDAGGESDTWSITPTRTMVAGSGFGVRFLIDYEPDQGESSQEYRLDHVEVTIYYTEGEPEPTGDTNNAAMFLML